MVVQLWPQADWTTPFVLTPFVVECRAGEGFPVGEIADRIVEATESGAVLASRAPVIEEATRGRLVKSAVLRSALIGLAGARLGVSRPLLTLEQVRMLSQLRTVSAGSAVPTSCPSAPEAAVALLACGIRVSRPRALGPHGPAGSDRSRSRRGRRHVADREGVRGRGDTPSKPVVGSVRTWT